MCMEDIRIGREMYFDSITVSANIPPVPLLPADPNRTFIILSAHFAERWSLMSKPGNSDFLGIIIPPNVQPIILRVGDVGSVVTRQLWAGAEFGPIQVTIFYGGLNKQ